MKNYNRKRKPKHTAKAGYKKIAQNTIIFYDKISKAQSLTLPFSKANIKIKRFRRRTLFFVNEVMK